MADWLLVETFGDADPSVIGIGSAPKPFVPLRKVLRNPRTMALAAAAVTEVTATGAPIDRHTDDGERRLIVRPLALEHGPVHAVQLWIGRGDEPVPYPDPAGAWCFNLTTSKSTRSDELLDLYGVTPENRTNEQAVAGAFTRLVTNRDEGEALAKIVRSAPGAEHQAVWTLRRDDGALRAAHFACRARLELDVEGKPEVLMRGVTHDIGEAAHTPAAPPPTVLEYTVLAASTEVGEYRAIINLRTLTLIRWVGEPMPEIAWQQLPGEPAPAVHPDDIATAQEMSRGLAHGRTRGVIRVRTVSGAWIPLDVRAALMALDQHTTAGLVTVTAAS